MCNKKYWIKFKLPWQCNGFSRLALALFLSLLLHFFLIERFSFNLPEFNDKNDLIEIRLVPTVAKINSNRGMHSVVINSVKRNAVKPMPTSKLDLTPTEKFSLTELPSLPTVSLPSTIEAVEPDPVIINSSQESQIENSDLIVNRNPYQYIETNFDVYTDKQPTLNSSVAGIAKITYQAMPKIERYQIKSIIHAKGLAALFVPDLLQTSDGYVTENGLQPMHYLYQFGNKKDKTFSADLEWESRKLTLHSENGDQQLDFEEGTQDLLSFMYQFMFVPPLQIMRLSITNGKKLGIYEYSFEGEEVISTKMGDLKTLHLLRMALEGEKKTELWLSLDYQYVPVKIRETDKEGKVYEMLVNEIKTE